MSNRKINVEKIHNRRKQLSELYLDYKNLDSFKNSVTRGKKSQYYKTIKKVLSIFFVDLILYIVGLAFISYFTKSVLFIWIIFLLCTIYIITTSIDGLKNYTKDIEKYRDSELCDLLKKNGVNRDNIDLVIQYYDFELESNTADYVKPIRYKVFFDFGTNIFYLLIGTLIPKVISDHLEVNKLQTYAIIVSSLILIIITMGLFRLYMYIDNSDKKKYVKNIIKLISELKTIKILNKL